MNRSVLLAYLTLLLIAIPTTAFAEGESFNPPGWAGAGMFALALILPIATYLWVRGRS